MQPILSEKTTKIQETIKYVHSYALSFFGHYFLRRGCSYIWPKLFSFTALYLSWNKEKVFPQEL